MQIDELAIKQNTITAQIFIHSMTAFTSEDLDVQIHMQIQPQQAQQ